MVIGYFLNSLHESSCIPTRLTHCRAWKHFKTSPEELLILGTDITLTNARCVIPCRSFALLKLLQSYWSEVKIFLLVFKLKSPTKTRKAYGSTSNIFYKSLLNWHDVEISKWRFLIPKNFCSFNYFSKYYFVFMMNTLLRDWPFIGYNIIISLCVKKMGLIPLRLEFI